MPRRSRGDGPDTWHHAVNRAIAKRPYFESRDDKRYFLSRLATQVRAGRIEVHAFSLMTTHFHLLLRSPVGEMSEAMRRVQCSYSRYFNRRRRRDGPLIRARYFSKPIDNDAYWRAVVRYIDDNAVRARVSRSIGGHEFGSARSFLGGRRPPWLSFEEVQSRALVATGARDFDASVYRAAYGPRSGEDLDSLREVIEGRLRSAREVDPLHDLIGATSPQVRAWLRRKSALADGMEIGLPVCSAPGLRRALDRELHLGGDWYVSSEGRIWSGSELTWIGLLRSLCALPLERVAAVHRSTVWRVRRDLERFRSLLGTDARLAERVERVTRAALEATVPFVR